MTSSPLRNRKSPAKDAEAGPTPQKSATAGVDTTAAAAAGVVPKKELLSSRTKKLIAFGLIVGGVVGIAIGASQAKKNASSAGENASSPTSRKPGSPGTTKAPTHAPEALPKAPPIRVCDLPRNLGEAVWFNGFFDTFWANGSNIEGRLAVSADAWVNRFSVGNGLFGKEMYGCPNNPDSGYFDYANYAFIVGGKLSINDSMVNNGGLMYASSNTDLFSISSSDVQSGCSITNSYQLQFGTIKSDLEAASRAIKDLSSNAGAFSKYTVGTDAVILKLNGEMLYEFFVVKESDLLSKHTLKITGTPKVYNGTTATIVIQVLMENPSKEFVKVDFNTQGFTEEINRQILWNFGDYEYISLQRGTWPGSILAPKANFEYVTGNIYGSIFAKGWNTEHQQTDFSYHNTPFNGNVFTNNCPTLSPTFAP